MIYRVGWGSHIVPPKRFGRWWVWVGPYMIGWRLP